MVLNNVLINYPAASGWGMKDPTHLAKKVSPQAAGNITLGSFDLAQDPCLHCRFGRQEFDLLILLRKIKVSLI